MARRITPVMKKVLAEMKTVFAAQAAHELDRFGLVLWGVSASAFPSWKLTTINALEKAGLIETQRKASWHSRLRYGAYGRWIGGTVRDCEVTVIVRPKE